MLVLLQNASGVMVATGGILGRYSSQHTAIITINTIDTDVITAIEVLGQCPFIRANVLQVKNLK